MPCNVCPCAGWDSYSGGLRPAEWVQQSIAPHQFSSTLRLLGHDTRLMPAKYVRAYSKGQKNDFRDAEAIAEAVQRRR